VRSRASWPAALHGRVVRVCEKPTRRAAADIILCGDDLGVGPQHSAEARPVHHDDRENHVAEPDAQARHQDQGEDNRRKGHPDFDEPTDQPVDLAAEIAGDMAEHGAHQHRAEGAEEGDRDRHARAVEKTRQNAASEAVGPKGYE